MATLLKNDGSLEQTSFLVCADGIKKYQASIKSPKKPTPELIKLMSRTKGKL